MKLSAVKGERTLDVIADCIGPIVNIGADPEASALFERKTPPEGMTPNQFMAQRLAKGLPALLKGHKRDIVAILAAIQGVPPKKYAKELDLGKLFSDLLELLTDLGFGGLFPSPGQKEDPKPSGDALATIEGQGE